MPHVGREAPRGISITGVPTHRLLDGVSWYGLSRRECDNVWRFLKYACISDPIQERLRETVRNQGKRSVNTDGQGTIIYSTRTQHLHVRNWGMAECLRVDSRDGKWRRHHDASAEFWMTCKNKTKLNNPLSIILKSRTEKSQVCYARRSSFLPRHGKRDTHTELWDTKVLTAVFLSDGLHGILISSLDSSSF